MGVAGPDDVLEDDAVSTAGAVDVVGAGAGAEVGAMCCSAWFGLGAGAGGGCSACRSRLRKSSFETPEAMYSLSSAFLGS